MCSYTDFFQIALYITPKLLESVQVLPKVDDSGKNGKFMCVGTTVRLSLSTLDAITH